MGTQAYTDPNVGSGHPIERALLILTCLRHWMGTKEFQGKFPNVCPALPGSEGGTARVSLRGAVTGKEPVGDFCGTVSFYVSIGVLFVWVSKIH